MPLEFRILGLLEIVDGARTISIRAGNDRALLALLLLHANEPVSSDRLIEELWGESPPQTAPKILQSSVSRVRRELGSERVETRGRGYVMHVSPDELDASRFERFVRDGMMREALALWRGTPFTELDGRVFAAAARRLEEIHLDALESRIDEDIANGAAAAVVPELEALTAEHPFRERLPALLMRALYADGRQTEALEVYRRTRQTLADELGLEPGPELQELERAILRQDPALPRPKPPARQRVRRRRRVAAVVASAAILAGVAIAVIVLTRGGAATIVVLPNSVVVVDPSNDRVVASIPLGPSSSPGAVAAGSSGVWVGDPAEQTVKRIDPQRLTIARSYNVGGAAADIVLDNDAAWIVTGHDNTLVRIDTRSGRMETTPLPTTSAGAYAVAAGGGALWVASNTLLKIDPRTATVVGRATDNCCTPLDVTFGAGAAWVGQRGEDVAKVGASSLRLVTDQDLGELELHLEAGYGSIWVAGLTTAGGGDQPSVVWRLDPSTGLPTGAVPLGRFKSSPYNSTVGIAIGEGGVWVALQEDNAIFKLDPKTGHVLAEIPTGRPPIAVAAGNGRVWVTVR